MTSAELAKIRASVLECLVENEPLYDVARFEVELSNTGGRYTVEVLSRVRTRAPLDDREYGIRVLNSNGGLVKEVFAQTIDEVFAASDIKGRLDSARQTGFIY